jgi:hypothetical protein
MKLLLLPIAASMLLPATALAAPGKLYGGFAPKKKIVLVVVDRESVRTEGLKVKNNAKIPKGIPNFSVGDNVTLKIGPKGALLIDESRIKFRDSTDRVNYYSNKAPDEGEKGNVATIRKGKKGKNAISGEITFYTYKTEGLKLITNRVTYELAK